MNFDTIKRSRRVKIGIDVGGTFTHAVAVDARSAELLGKAMVPTTHTAKEGVALGVVESLKKLIESVQIHPAEVVLIAHSTTQATNALLEGDVAAVGIIGMGKGAMKLRMKSQENIKGLEIAPQKFLKTHFAFVDTTNGLMEELIREAVEKLRVSGAEVFVCTEGFGVDDPLNEAKAAQFIRNMGYQCAIASEISHLYGLKMRTQTAAINASMLPKMLEAAVMTETSVKSSGIAVPLMIMRSDGGIMDIDEMRKRPILTMLSGPAAGVAAALMYVRVSEGIFVEAGGTSTDISIIHRGRPVLKTAEVGGKRLFLKTLDVRTVGVAGGSMVRLSAKGNLIDVGPRSAHIAGLKYISFSAPEEFPDPQIHLIKPTPSDPDDYCAISGKPGEEPKFALTATDAANYLGLIKGEYARGDRRSVEKVFDRISKTFNLNPEDFATEILEKAAQKISRVVESLVDEYKLNRELLHLVGGGGAAEVIVPFTANRVKAQFSISENAEVVSAIGVALGLIQETVERNVVQPTEQDILKIRQEAVDGVLRMGASAETVEVHVEIDQRARTVSATAYGTPELRTNDLSTSPLPDWQLSELAAKALLTNPNELIVVGETRHLCVYKAIKLRKSFLGLKQRRQNSVVVIDRRGITRLTLSAAETFVTNVGAVFGMLPVLLDKMASYSDAGLLAPDVFLVVGGRVIDLSSLVSVNQIMTVCRAEIEEIPSTETVIVIVVEKRF